MSDNSAAGIIAHAIQLSIAPAFLLNGIAGLLGMIANRLARVIDRGRHFDQIWDSLDERARLAARREIAALERRRSICSWSINWCTTGALLICFVMVALFAEEYFAANVRQVTGALFVGAMISVICGLACFLREVSIATHATMIDSSRFE